MSEVIIILQMIMLILFIIYLFNNQPSTSFTIVLTDINPLYWVQGPLATVVNTWSFLTASNELYNSVSFHSSSPPP